MAKVLSSFLIGIGYDLDRKSLDTATSSIDSLGSKAKQLGALLAGAFGVKSLLGLAKSATVMDAFSQKTSASISTIKALGAEYKRFGGDVNDAVRDIESAYAVMTMHEADQAGFMQTMGKIGVDGTQLLNAKNYAEYFERIQKIGKQLSGDRKAQFFQAVGLSAAGEASVRQEANIGTRIEEQQAARPDVEKANKDLTELHRSMAELQTLAASFGDKILTILVPAITRVTEAVSGWLAENQDLINSGIDMIFGGVADNLGVIAALLGGAAIIKGVQTIMLLSKAFSALAGSVKSASDNASSLGNSLPAIGGCECGEAGSEAGESKKKDDGKKSKGKKARGKKGTALEAMKLKATANADSDLGDIAAEDGEKKKGSKRKSGRGKKLAPVATEAVSDVGLGAAKTKGGAKIAEAAGDMLTKAATNPVIGKVAAKAGARIASKFIPPLALAVEAAFLASELFDSYKTSKGTGASFSDALRENNWLYDMLMSGVDAVSGNGSADAQIATAADYTQPALSVQDAASAAYTAAQVMQIKSESKSQPININIKSELDGRVLDQRTIKVLGEQVNTAMSDFNGAILG